MTFRAAPGVVSNLDWFFNESAAAIAGLRSTWNDVIMVKQQQRAFVYEHGRYLEAAPLRCGPIYVPKESHHQALHELSEPALHAAAREAPILSALRAAGEDVFDALRHRFREKLLVCTQHVPEYLRPLVVWDRKGCRVPFGLEGASGRRDGPMDGCLGVMLNPLRGCGGAAHLTTAARAAYAQDRLRLRVRLDLPGWVDRLGARICAREAGAANDEGRGPEMASDEELALGRELRRQAEALVYGEGGALDRYSRLLVHRRRAG